LLSAGTQSIRFRPVLHVTIDNIELMLAKLDRALMVLYSRDASLYAGTAKFGIAESLL